MGNMGPEHMNTMELGMGCGFVGITCTDFGLDRVYFIWTYAQDLLANQH